MAYLGTLAAAAVFAHGIEPGSAVELAVTIVAVAAIGLPHGALDLHVTGLRLREPASLGRATTLRTLLIYLTLAASTLALWILSAPLGLALLVVASLFHFGRDDREDRSLPGWRRPLEVLLLGGLPIVAPIIFHPDTVARLFGIVMDRDPGAVAAMLARSSPWLAAATLAGVLAHAASLLATAWRRRSPRILARMAEPVALLATGASLPPLLFFTLYFCLGHSLRHLLRLAHRLDWTGPSEGIRVLVGAAGPVVVLSLVLGVGAWVVVTGTSGGTGPDAAVRTLFVGLAVVTTPHLWVTETVVGATGTRPVR